jgi:ABC-type sulfate/molybdate transport systems ATPase subunit
MLYRSTFAAMLSVTNLSKYVSPDFQLSPITFNQVSGENLALIGVSGSGKSTLLQLIAGWQQPDTGSVTLFSERIKGPQEQLVPGHPGLAILEQSSHLPHYYYIRDLFQYANVWETSVARNLFSLCRIEHLMNRKHHEISGGEQQRIALALLLITSPRWLLLDEPFSHLDLTNKKILQQVLADVTRKLNISCLLCSHNPDDIFAWAHRLLVLENGNLVQVGSPEVIYHSPQNSYVAGLLGDFYPLSSELAQVFFPEKFALNTANCWMVRPEHLLFQVESTHHAVKATILQVTLAGRDYKVDVEVMEQQLSFYTQTNSLKAGTKGYLLATNGYCFPDC